MAVLLAWLLVVHVPWMEIPALSFRQLHAVRVKLVRPREAGCFPAVLEPHAVEDALWVVYPASLH